MNHLSNDQQNRHLKAEPDPSGRISGPKYVVSWLAWPFLLGTCIAGLAYGSQFVPPVVAFNLTYLYLILSLLVLERLMPHEPQWNKNDGQTLANIAHTLTSKGTVQGIVIFGGVIGLSNYVSSLEGEPYGIWPRDWPLWGQVALALVLAEFMLYWAHRFAHEWPPLWNFHAVHHSVTRLWIVNTGRFHFIDSLISVGLGSAIVIALGAPMEVIIWLSAMTAFIGMLTHCNMEMRFGPISYIFNTPGLHRWHHSQDLREGNKNYGENLVIWDQLFGTFYNPDRRPPKDIGIPEYMPERFIDQLLYPFRVGYYRQKGREIEKNTNGNPSHGSH